MSRNDDLSMGLKAARFRGAHVRLNRREKPVLVEEATVQFQVERIPYRLVPERLQSVLQIGHRRPVGIAPHKPGLEGDQSLDRDGEGVRVHPIHDFDDLGPYTTVPERREREPDENRRLK